MANFPESLYQKLRILAEQQSIHIISPAKNKPMFFTEGQRDAVRLHADCPVCALVGPSTGRISSKDQQPTMTILKARRPGMRTLFNILHGPKRKLHKKRSNQTEAYHRRIQKKWDKKWRETHEYSTQPLIMSAGPKLSAFLTEFQSKSRLGRKPKPVVIKEITSEDLDARRAVRKTDAGQLQEGQEPAQDTTGLPGGV